MRRTACGLVATAFASLAVAAPASADNEVTDPCGLVNNPSVPSTVNNGAPAPWLDLCGADVRGTAANGPLRGIHTTLHLAGDTANRAGSAAYGLVFQGG